MNMLEKMARATYDKWNEDVRSLEPSWNDLPESHRARLIDASRAALLAIREPCPAIVAEVTASGWLEGDLRYDGVWQTTIDSILNEAPDPS